jgi:sugar lactone lactonase YvrE
MGTWRMMANIEWELVAEGLKFPEGPVAVAGGSVALVEMQAERITRVAPDGKVSVIAETGAARTGWRGARRRVLRPQQRRRVHL